MRPVTGAMFEALADVMRVKKGNRLAALQRHHARQSVACRATNFPSTLLAQQYTRRSCQQRCYEAKDVAVVHGPQVLAKQPRWWSHIRTLHQENRCWSVRKSNAAVDWIAEAGWPRCGCVHWKSQQGERQDVVFHLRASLWEVIRCTVNCGASARLFVKQSRKGTEP